VLKPKKNYWQKFNNQHTNNKGRQGLPFLFPEKSNSLSCVAQRVVSLFIPTTNKTVAKVIVVPHKLVNIVVK
jgi:hypothetical protein